MRSVSPVLCGLLLVALIEPGTVARDKDNDGDNDSIELSGGGQGTFANSRIDPWDANKVDGDLDGDGHVDGSYFVVAVEASHHKVQGHFVCAMWGNTRFLGLPLMGVEGQVSHVRTNKRTRVVTLEGVGTVDLGGPTLQTNVPFVAKVTAGGPGEATVQLTVIGAFDGVPGDTIPGNNNYDLPIETLISGIVAMSKH
jgi:hypothetical protein